MEDVQSDDSSDDLQRLKRRRQHERQPREPSPALSADPWGWEIGPGMPPLRTVRVCGAVSGSVHLAPHQRSPMICLGPHERL